MWTSGRLSSNIKNAMFSQKLRITAKSFKSSEKSELLVLSSSNYLESNLKPVKIFFYSGQNINRISEIIKKMH